MKWLSKIAVVVMLVALACEAACAAPPTVNQVVPGGVRRGEKTNVLLGGAFKWPVTILSSSPALQVTVGKEVGQIEVTAAASGSEGLHFLRLVDSEGATAPFPFAVGTLPEVTEKEPNNSPKQAQGVTLPLLVNGRLQNNGDSDVYQVTLAAEETLVATVDARCYLGSPMDTIMQVCDAQGFVLQQSNDLHGLDPQIAFKAPKAGTYLIRLFGYDAEPNAGIHLAGAANFVYRLTLTTGVQLDYTLPIAVNRAGGTSHAKGHGFAKENAPAFTLAAVNATGALPRTHHFAHHIELPGLLRMPLRDFACMTQEQASAGEVVVPVSISGCFAAREEKHNFRVRGTPKAKLNVKVISVNEEYQVDPLIVASNAAGAKLVELDDSEGKRDCEFAVAVPDDGLLLIAVSDFLGEIGPRHAYELVIQEQIPRVVPTVAASTFAPDANKVVTIPVALQRVEGFAAELEIVAEGLPEGWSAPPVVSAATGETATAVKLVLTATAEAKPGMIRLICREKTAPEKTTEVLYSVALGAVNVGFAEIYLPAPAPAP